MTKITKLSKDEIIEINKRLGEGGIVVNQGNFEHMLDKLGHIEDPVECATVLLHDIILRHPFLNGNKRTAFYAAISVIELRGLKFKYAREEIDKVGIFLNRIALGEINKLEIRKWIEEMIV
jgi:death-on-curing family protein